MEWLGPTPHFLTPKRLSACESRPHLKLLEFEQLVLAELWVPEERAIQR